MTRAQLEQRLAALRQQHTNAMQEHRQLEANINALNGAIQLATELLLNFEEPAKEPATDDVFDDVPVAPTA